MSFILLSPEQSQIKLFKEIHEKCIRKLKQNIKSLSNPPKGMIMKNVEHKQKISIKW